MLSSPAGLYLNSAVIAIISFADTSTNTKWAFATQGIILRHSDRF